MILTIVSTGPGDPSLMNLKTEEALRTARRLVLRTGRHPIAGWLDSQGILFCTMDDLYESSDDFDNLAKSLAFRLWDMAAQTENTVYAVSDTMTDHTVDAVFSAAPPGARIQLLPGFSFADYYLPVCRPFFSTSDIRVCPARSFIGSNYDPMRPVLITELNDEITAGEVKQFLSVFVKDEETVFFLNGNASVLPVKLYDLDRQPSYDHLSAVAAGSFPYSSRSRKTLEDLMEIMDRLRSDDGCPWDRAQTHDSLKPYVVEEAWEVVDAVQENHPEHLAEELGDLLFQVVFHTSIAKSFDEFTMDDVIESICEKMIRRHPHVFGDSAGSSPTNNVIEDSWDRIKQEETGSRTPVEALRDISTSLPSLRYTEKVIRKLRRVPGIRDLSIDEIISAIRKNADGISGGSLGLLLFFCACFALHIGIDSEVLLHQTVHRLILNCEALERDRKISPDNPKPLTFNDLGVY